MNQIEKTTRAQKVALRLMGVVRGWNKQEPPIHLRHANLKEMRVAPYYRRLCPVCEEGWLLLEVDVCTLCGQHFVYDDIEEMRKLDRGKPLENPDAEV